MARPPHEPTEVSRELVKALSGFGIRSDAIAKKIGIAPKTLRKHYRCELDLGEVDAIHTVANALFKNAVTNENVSAQIFFLKARAGWSEKFELDHNDRVKMPKKIVIVAENGNSAS